MCTPNGYLRFVLSFSRLMMLAKAFLSSGLSQRKVLISLYMIDLPFLMICLGTDRDGVLIMSFSLWLVGGD